jgi:hypothetical protein
MDHREIDCEDGRWMELAQVRVRGWVLLLAVLKLSGSANTVLVS